jgi:hypothetical protein
MAVYPAPTYLVGIDETRATGYIGCIRKKMNKPISSLPTTYPLDCTNLKILWEEVKGYWANRDMTQTMSAFSIEE